jgi:hypothetical protein
LKALFLPQWQGRFNGGITDIPCRVFLAMASKNSLPRGHAAGFHCPCLPWIFGFLD